MCIHGRGFGSGKDDGMAMIGCWENISGSWLWWEKEINGKIELPFPKENICGAWLVWDKNDKKDSALVESITSKENVSCKWNLTTSCESGR